MDRTLTIVAHARAKHGLEDLMITAQKKLVASTIKRPGCIRYELHVSNQDPAQVTFVEEWSSVELWQQHMSSPAIEEFRKNAGHTIGEFSLMEMHRVA